VAHVLDLRAGPVGHEAVVGRTTSR